MIAVSGRLVPSSRVTTNCGPPPHTPSPQRACPQPRLPTPVWLVRLTRRDGLSTARCLCASATSRTRAKSPHSRTASALRYSPSLLRTQARQRTARARRLHRPKPRRTTGPPPGPASRSDVVASIGALTSAAQGVSYYERDGYYAKDDAEHRAASAWLGTGAAEAGLEGTVDPEAFRAVLEGVRAGRLRAPARAHRQRRGAPAPPRPRPHPLGPEIGLPGGAGSVATTASSTPMTGPLPAIPGLRSGRR